MRRAPGAARHSAWAAPEASTLRGGLTSKSEPPDPPRTAPQNRGSATYPTAPPRGGSVTRAWGRSLAGG